MLIIVGLNHIYVFNVYYVLYIWYIFIINNIYITQKEEFL
jgi:hypothetical protein